MKLLAPLAHNGQRIQPRVGVISLLFISWLTHPSPITVRLFPIPKEDPDA